MTTFNVYRGEDGILTFEENGRILFTIKTKTQANADKALGALVAMEAASQNQIEDFDQEEDLEY
jgi:hypothetical protein